MKNGKEKKKKSRISRVFQPAVWTIDSVSNRLIWNTENVTRMSTSVLLNVLCVSTWNNLHSLHCPHSALSILPFGPASDETMSTSRELNLRIAASQYWTDPAARSPCHMTACHSGSADWGIPRALNVNVKCTCAWLYHAERTVAYQFPSPFSAKKARLKVMRWHCGCQRRIPDAKQLSVANSIATDQSVRQRGIIHALFWLKRP